MQSGVSQAVADLIKSGNADNEPTTLSVPEFKIDDIYPIFEKYFNQKAQVVMGVKASHLVHQRNIFIAPMGFVVLLKKLGLKSVRDFADADLYIRHADMVHFCVSRADRANLQQAVIKVVKTINELANKGYITACMTKLSVVALAKFGMDRDYAVISYVALTQQGHDYVEQNMPKMFIKEGGYPPRYDEQ